jgi:hypothetical protein
VEEVNFPFATVTVAAVVAIVGLEGRAVDGGQHSEEDGEELGEHGGE